MKKMFKSFAAVCLAAITMTACQKDARESVQNEISDDVIGQIKAMGFSADEVKKTDKGYLVEGDILLKPSDLTASVTSPNLIIASEEQYRTFNLVNITAHPVIKVALNNTSATHEAAFSAAVDEAIRRYNAESLLVTFQRVTSDPDITIYAYREVSNVLGYAGFPTASGDPFNEVQMNTYHYSTGTTTTNINYIATIMAHEMGHCIGFRHTDYANRAYSCGGRRSNEGQATNGVGAVHIPGTPTGADANSWMLACIAGGVNRPFNANDKIALAFLY
jgi:hypothetical protein